MLRGFKLQNERISSQEPQRIEAKPEVKPLEEAKKEESKNTAKAAKSAPFTKPTGKEKAGPASPPKQFDDEIEEDIV